MKILGCSLLVNLIWAFGYAYLKDFHPEYETFAEVFKGISIMHGCVNVFGLLLIGPMSDSL
ncbi:MAG: hypothetical protein IH948_09430 [Bacteroidetes bacterium]|nr:hypothetical protein [Bacteroidota bacterium]